MNMFSQIARGGASVRFGAWVLVPAALALIAGVSADQTRAYRRLAGA